MHAGKERRAAIARSLAACEPWMMLYDEPTTEHDPLTAETICSLINDLSSGDLPDEAAGIKKDDRGAHGRRMGKAKQMPG